MKKKGDYMKTNEIFLELNTIAKDLITSYDSPWEILPNIKDFIIELGHSLNDDYEQVEENIWIHKNAIVAKTAFIKAPTIIDDGAEIRHCAFIRGSVIVGKHYVLGNSCEIKNAILFDNVEVPHFNYVGDSILGYHSHMGAGSITSNVKSDRQLVKIKYQNDIIETNIKKVGAFLGDYVEVGCNSVLNPGTIVKPYTNIYPLTSVRGVIDGNSIVKSMKIIVKKEVR